MILIYAHDLKAVEGLYSFFIFHHPCLELHEIAHERKIFKKNLHFLNNALFV